MRQLDTLYTDVRMVDWEKTISNQVEKFYFLMFLNSISEEPLLFDFSDIFSSPFYLPYGFVLCSLIFLNL